MSPFFEGWYFRHQWQGRTAAFIPAHHRDAAGVYTASLQILTDDAAHCLEIPVEDFSITRRPFCVRAGESTFALTGCTIDCPLPQGRLAGRLDYGPIAPIRGDIMGPFRYLPGMQCRHSVLSMTHTVSGGLTLDDRPWSGGRGLGYVEGDRGTSFPARYLWTQAHLSGGGSVMLSVADVPLPLGHITGCIGVVWRNGREQRLATYRGVRVLRIGAGGATVRQGPWTLAVELLESRPTPLRAPSTGAMTRTIHESAACRVRYRLTKNGETLLDETCPHAAFEAEWEAD